MSKKIKSKRARIDGIIYIGTLACYEKLERFVFVCLVCTLQGGADHFPL